MDIKTDIHKKIIDVIRDTKEYLLSLKETGVEEVWGQIPVGFSDEPTCRQADTKEHENPVCHPDPELDSGVSGSLGKEILKPLNQVQGQNDREAGFSDENVDRMAQKLQRLEGLREKIGDCKRCKLWKGRTNIVFGTGNPDSPLMFVGEGPGEEEDRRGEPFVGKAGELLTKMIEAMGLVRDDVYIANVVKCRPPNNRNPEEDEIAACKPFLDEQINIIKPKVICALGTFASQTLLETKTKISELRGKVHEKGGDRIAPTFHPAYLLRNQQQKGLAWKDLQLVMKELGLKR